MGDKWGMNAGERGKRDHRPWVKPEDDEPWIERAPCHQCRRSPWWGGRALGTKRRQHSSRYLGKASRAVGLPLPHRRAAGAARSILYGLHMERRAVGTAISAPGWAKSVGNVGGDGESGVALVPEFPAWRPAIEKTAKNPILAAATGEARNHW